MLGAAIASQPALSIADAVQQCLAQQEAQLDALSDVTLLSNQRVGGGGVRI